MNKLAIFAVVVFLGVVGFLVLSNQGSSRPASSDINFSLSPTDAIPTLATDAKTSPAAADADTTPAEIPTATKAIIATDKGDITIEFYGADAPKTVANFVKLANSGFYEGIKFHRIIADFMVQGGDPNTKTSDESTWGQGGPGYKFEDEFNSHKLVRGSLAMANSGPNTNGSQFFIVTTKETPWLDGKHTNFGEVTTGMDVVDKLKVGDKILSVTVE